MAIETVADQQRDERSETDALGGGELGERDPEIRREGEFVGRPLERCVAGLADLMRAGRDVR
jgi:hypothetical protein